MPKAVDAPESAPVWHTLAGDAAAARLGSDLIHGLTTAEVGARQARHGPNQINEAARRTKLRMLLAQFADFMILLLVVAAIVSSLIGEPEDAIVILGIVLLNAAVGFVQEFRANRAMAALKQLASPSAMVVRDGLQRVVPSEAIVPGDIVVLDTGNAVPADLRLVEAVNLRLGEAALTGESLPVDKQTEASGDTILPLADRRNMAFKGTSVLHGRGRGVAVATGMATELGHIAGMLEGGGGARTPLQRRLTVFGRQIATAALVICGIIFVTGVLRGEPPLLMLLTALSLAVAAIPEALPAVITVLLALGAGRMARENALIRRLPAVETLGSVTTICSDKTGTLTHNEMRAVEVFLAGQRVALDRLDPAHHPAATLLLALALCNDAAPGPDGEMLGDPTEIALWRLAAKAGIDIAERVQSARRVLELPFDSERKRMTTFHIDRGGFVAYTKGAPEMVFACCSAMAMGTREVAFELTRAMQAADRMAQAGLRVLAVACRRWDELPDDRTANVVENGLTLLGLVGLLDPPREEAQAAVETCRAAGIVPVMITGDHPVTARAIARQVGILADGGMILTGRELQALSDAELQAVVHDVQIYARVDPTQKIRIVTALQDVGEIVAMTGDGVNDAPALARADIGVAMGRIGTDVARESASLVLLDDNFATIVAAVREGRRIYDNIYKFIRFVVTCNSAEIWTIFLAPFLGLPLPLLPIQILWMNLVTDGLPGLALAAEPAEHGVMRRPPRSAREGLFARGMAWQVIWVGLLMAASTLLIEAFAFWTGRTNWQTMVFTVLTLTQMWQVLAIRSDHAVPLRQSLFGNPALLGAVLLTSVLQLAVIYVPLLNAVFSKAPLTPAELLSCIAMSSIVFIAIDLDKRFVRRRVRPT